MDHSFGYQPQATLPSVIQWTGAFKVLITAIAADQLKTLQHEQNGIKAQKTYYHSPEKRKKHKDEREEEEEGEEET